MPFHLHLNTQNAILIFVAVTVQIKGSVICLSDAAEMIYFFFSSSFFC